MAYHPADSISSESTAGERPPSPRNEDIPAPRLARGILLVVLACFSVLIFLDALAQHPSGDAVPWWAASLVAAVGLQVQHSSPVAVHWSMPRRTVSLTLQALVTYLPLLAVGQDWGGVAGFLAGSFLLLVPGVLSWILFTLVVVSILVPALALGIGALDTTYLTVSTSMIGLIVYSLSRLTGLVTELIAAREDRARLAVVRERLRFASDMHDILGLSLSAITLKSELAYRLAGGQPERTRAELSEILDISRQALADVRGVAHGYRQLSLATEADNVRAALTAARIDTRIDFHHGPLSQEADTVLAVVLREAATNILRHSKATRCSIQTTMTGESNDRIRLSVRNDGVVPRISAEQTTDSTGLRSLAARLSAVRGTLATRASHGHEFQLVADVPSHADSRAAHPRARAAQDSTVA